MFNSSTQNIIVLVVVCTVLILLLITFITVIVYRYQQKQNAYYKGIEELKMGYENALLQTKIEIQEQTFENISLEIHDNIGQKLTLAKLYLNTISVTTDPKTARNINDAVKLIGESINDLSDISRSMSADIVMNKGLIKALEYETVQLQKSGLFKINLVVSGNIVFLEAQHELVLFRIVQEALNNIVKHAAATFISLDLLFNSTLLILTISDNGKGFVYETTNKRGIGLANMKSRAETLKGKFKIISEPGIGTSIQIEIPIL